jgi:hypothetical protein
MTVLLRPTPQHQTFRILVGTSIRKPAHILQAYLHTLAWQILPPNASVSYCFVMDTDEIAACHVMEQFVTEHGGALIRPPVGPNDTNDQHPVTHQWSPSGMARVGQNKNLILKHALEQRYDAVWLVDADLLCDRTTLLSLWSAKAPIACAVYWTRWHQTAQKMAAAPQVWLTHPYGLEGRGYDQAEFRRELVERQRIEVWGQGACTLIRISAIEKGVNFDYIPGVPTDGMMAGEDRHFCLRAEGLHLPMFADGWPDIFHVYHPSDAERIPEMLERLGKDHPTHASRGDWVNAILEPLEPVFTPPGSAHLIPPLWYRGLLGSPMLPELEDALLTMTVGETRTIGLHYPAHYPLAQFRGQRRLLKVTLVDAKPWGYAPVVEQELMVGRTTKVMADRTTLSVAQQQAMEAA